MPRATLAVPKGFSFDRTVRSHGWYDLPPFRYDRTRGVLAFSWRSGPGVVDISVAATAAGLSINATGISVTAANAAVRSVLRLDEDLRPALDALHGEPRLRAALRAGGGRLLRGPTFFEDVGKMICTTNCSWALTRLMVTRLCDALGERGRADLPTFPTPGAMADRPERFYRDVIRAGYRAPFLRDLAQRVAKGTLDLEAMRASAEPSEALRQRLLDIDGVGPYAADNLLRLLGRYDRLGLDSWCRSKYRELYPSTRKAGLDAAIERRYQPFAPYQGLALWLDLTRDWFSGREALWP